MFASVALPCHFCTVLSSTVGAVDSIKDNTPMVNKLAKDLVMDYLSVGAPKSADGAAGDARSAATSSLSGWLGRSRSTEEAAQTPVKAFGAFLHTGQH